MRIKRKNNEDEKQKIKFRWIKVPSVESIFTEEQKIELMKKPSFGPDHIIIILL